MEVGILPLRQWSVDGFSGFVIFDEVDGGTHWFNLEWLTRR